jgi:glycine dehydrogenase
MRENLKPQDIFEYRHHGKMDESTKRKLEQVGVSSFDELIDQTIPKSIRLKEPVKLPEPLTELAFLDEAKALAGKIRYSNLILGKDIMAPKHRR